MYSSRLSRREEKQNIRKAILLIAGTILILILAGFFAIPILTRTAIFISSLNSKNTIGDKLDTIPPGAPQIIFSYDATNSATQVLSGRSEAGSTVYLTQNTIDRGNVVTDVDGNFQFTQISLSLGNNLFNAVAIDQAGNKSLTSSEVHLVYMNQPPKLDLQFPTDQQTFDKNALQLKGSTENATRVTVNDRNIILNSDGQFDTNFPLNPGDNVLIFIVYDSAGNQTRKELTVTFQQ